MQELNLTYQQSKDLLNRYIKDPITKLHCIESEAIMRALAKHFGDDEENWGIIGLLHDIDWELTKDNTAEHCVKAVEILNEAGASDFLIETIISTASGQGWDEQFYGAPEYKDKIRSTKIQYALAAAETVTGLIIAAVLVRPDRKLQNLELKSLKKRFKEKSFAANCRREIILECEKAGLPLDEFLSIGLKALQGIAGAL